MAIKLTNTKQAAAENGVKILTVGMAGSGKTVLAGTMPGNNVIISAEAGLLSLRHQDIPVIEVQTIEDVREAYHFLTDSQEGKQFDSVSLDSISEIAEVVLHNEKLVSKDARQAYGALAEHMGELVRAFRDMQGRNVYMSCKMEKTKDDLTGGMLYGPSMPGQRVSQALPYWFDEVFVLRVEKGPDGELQRWLQTCSDLQYNAKDRSGSLDMFEPPDLTHVIQKIHGHTMARPKVVNQ